MEIAIHENEYRKRIQKKNTEKEYRKRIQKKRNGEVDHD